MLYGQLWILNLLGVQEKEYIKYYLFTYRNMPNEMEYWEPIDDDSWEDDDGLEDVSSADLSGIAQQTKRSLDEILQLEYEIINSNTELSPEEWISRYAEKFREILTKNPSLTEFQVKWHLYMDK